VEIVDIDRHFQSSKQDERIIRGMKEEESSLRSTVVVKNMFKNLQTHWEKKAPFTELEIDALQFLDDRNRGITRLLLSP
jgi:hypothetical protein